MAEKTYWQNFNDSLRAVGTGSTDPTYFEKLAGSVSNAGSTNTGPAVWSPEEKEKLRLKNAPVAVANPTDPVLANVAPPPGEEVPPAFTEASTQQPAGAGQVYPVGMIPGQMQTAEQVTTMQSTQLTPEARRAAQAQNEALDAQTKAIEAGAQADIAKQETLNAIAQDEQSKQEAFNALNQQKAIERQQRLQGGLDKVSAAESELGKFEYQDFWSKKSTGQRILAGISMALGTIGQSLSGGPNTAMGIIDKAMEEDRVAQKENFNKLKGKVDTASNSYAMLRQTLGDETTADLAYQNQQLEQVAKRYDRVAKSSTDKQIVANAQLNASLVRSKQAEVQKNLAGTVTTQVVAKEAPTPAQMVMSDGSTQSMGGYDAKSIKELNEAMKGAPDIQAYREAKAGYESFKSYKESGVSDVAMVSFVASGLKQGSFGKEVMNMVDQRSLKQDAEEYVRKIFQGGARPELLKGIERGLKTEYDKAAARAAPQLKVMTQTARQMGVPESYVTGGKTQSDINQNVAGRAKLIPVGKK